MCSRMEAFGRVTVEALKAGLPVIGSNSGGTTEIIENNTNGVIFKYNNTNSLTNAIEKILLMETNNYKTLQNNALKTRYQYNKEKAKIALIKILES